MNQKSVAGGVMEGKEVETALQEIWWERSGSK